MEDKIILSAVGNMCDLETGFCKVDSDTSSVGELELAPN